MKEQIASHVGAVEKGKWGGRGVKWGALERRLEVRDLPLGEDIPEGQAVGEQKAEGPGGWAARGGQAIRTSAFSPSETEPAS